MLIGLTVFLCRLSDIQLMGARAQQGVAEAALFLLNKRGRLIEEGHSYK
jgi:hypothetical protein